MMRRVVIVVVALAVGAAALASCGGAAQRADRPATVADLSEWSPENRSIALAAFAREEARASGTPTKRADNHV
jgi:hypothetical protein